MDRWIEGRNFKNDEIGMFADHFFIDFDGFLTTHLHKYSQSDVKLIEIDDFAVLDHRHNFHLRP